MTFQNVKAGPGSARQFQPDPQTPGVPGGGLSNPSIDAGGAKMEGHPFSPPGRVCRRQRVHHAQSMQAAINHLRDLPHNAGEGEV